MVEASVTQCPDCGGALMSIKLFARVPVKNQLNSSDGAVTRYAAPEAKRGWFVPQYEIAGKVDARMCESCHRIFLYGHPGEDE